MKSFRPLFRLAAAAVIVSGTAAGFAAEKFDRAMIALRTGETTVYLGWNMNMGIWWTPFIVADFDGDGKAEVALKAAPFAATREESLAEKEGRARAEQDGTGKWVYSAATGELITEQDLGGLSPRAIWWGDTSTKAYIPGRSFGGAWGGGGGRRGGGGTGAAAGGASSAPAGAISGASPAGTTAVGATAPGPGGRGGGGFGAAGPSAIMKYGAGKIGEFEGRLIAIADLMGDWREEIVVSIPGEIRIYTTTIPTARRRVCLLQDPLYRKDVALQTMGYFYPPQLSYHFR